MGQKVKFISYIQLIGIVLVVLGHSLHMYPVNYGMGTLLYRMIYSFHMPLFFFVSGFLMIYTIQIKGRRTWNSFVSGKLKRMLVPFITLTTVTFVPRALLSDFADDVIPLSIESLAKAYIFKSYLVIPYLWFLQALLILLISSFSIFIIFERTKLSDKWFYIFTYILGVILPIIFGNSQDFFSLGMVCKNTLYFAIGMIYARYFTKIEKHLPSQHILYTLIWAFLWLISFYFLEFTQFRPICAITGILMCVGCSRQMEKHNCTFIDRFTGAHYIIFLLSWYFIVLCQQFLSHFMTLPWYCYSILSFTFGLFIPYLIFKLLNKYGHTPCGHTISILLGHNVSNKGLYNKSDKKTSHKN